jgi:hypothetical protein
MDATTGCELILPRKIKQLYPHHVCINVLLQGADAGCNGTSFERQSEHPSATKKSSITYLAPPKQVINNSQPKAASEARSPSPLRPDE